MHCSANNIAMYSDPANGTYTSMTTATVRENVHLPWGDELAVADLLLVDLE